KEILPPTRWKVTTELATPAIFRFRRRSTKNRPLARWFLAQSDRRRFQLLFARSMDRAGDLILLRKKRNRRALLPGEEAGRREQRNFSKATAAANKEMCVRKSDRTERP